MISLTNVYAFELKNSETVLQATVLEFQDAPSINLAPSINFSTFLWCFKRFYEDL